MKKQPVYFISFTHKVKSKILFDNQEVKISGIPEIINIFQIKEVEAYLEKQGFVSPKIVNIFKIREDVESVE